MSFFFFTYSLSIKLIATILFVLKEQTENQQPAQLSAGLLASDRWQRLQATQRWQ